MDILRKAITFNHLIIQHIKIKMGAEFSDAKIGTEQKMELHTGYNVALIQGSIFYTE